MNNDFNYAPPGNIISPDESINDILMNIADYLLLFIGSIAVLLFLFGAFLWVFSQGDEEKIQKAKTIFSYAVFGALLALLSFVIVKYVIGVFI